MRLVTRVGEQMKAWVLHGINDIRFEEIAKPTLGKEEVLVKVRAAGIYR